MGQVNYMMEIGADGKLKAMRQVLKAEQFAKVTPGLDKAQVRRLIGKPAHVQSFELKKEEVWDWRWLDNNAPKLFSVTFGADGRAASTAVSEDRPGGGGDRN
jgi:outer membrane protein assembly factor BamE (lipoprotein component of BamABCDE complex)